VEPSGKIKKVNLIVATGNNSLAINKSVNMVAKQYIKNNQITEGILNRVEMAIRCYDPCFSCSTHAIVGEMPLALRILSSDGKLLKEIQR